MKTNTVICIYGHLELTHAHSNYKINSRQTQLGQIFRSIFVRIDVQVILMWMVSRILAQMDDNPTDQIIIWLPLVESASIKDVLDHLADRATGRLCNLQTK